MLQKKDPPSGGTESDHSHFITNPPTSCIDPDRIAPAVAADLCWYGFRWNGKGTPPIYFSFPNADELTLEAGKPSAIIPAHGRGNPLDVAHAAVLNGAKLDGIAMLVPGAKRPELFNIRDGWLLWTRESTATEQEKVTLLDALGFYDEETRALIIANGMLPQLPAQPQAADSEQPRFRYTDTGNAERFAHQHRQQVRYCWEWRTWLAWDGTRWKTDSGAIIQALAKQTVRRIYAEAAQAATADHAKAIASHAMRSESSRGLFVIRVICCHFGRIASTYAAI